MKSIKNQKLDLRLSKQEKERIQHAAKIFNMNTSEFVRFACKKATEGRTSENADVL